MPKKFIVPKAYDGGPTQSMLVRIDMEDREKIRKISKETGRAMHEVIRRAVHFALENMK